MASYYKEHIINGSQDRVVGGLPEGENIQRNGNTLTITLLYVPRATKEIQKLRKGLLVGEEAVKSELLCTTTYTYSLVDDDDRRRIRWGPKVGFCVVLIS